MIIARKDAAGVGGNIYVDPQVTSIDATLIADGALINGTLENNVITPKVWFEDTEGELKNPLVINGRLLTYNTRGGSLEEKVANSGELKKARDNKDYCVSGNAITACTSIITAGLQDLERFRVVMRVPSELSDRCTLHVTGVMAVNRPDILTKVSF